MGQRERADGASQTFHGLTEQYLTDVYYQFNPTTGTGAGLHQNDVRLEDYAPATIAREIGLQRGFEKRVMAIDGAALDGSEAADREILLATIHSRLLTLETIKPFATNPDNYSSGVTNSAFVIMERPYAPAATRLRALVEREKLMPALLMEARTNLKNPPRISTEIALEQIDGNVSFFQNDVPSAFTEVTDPALKAAFAKTNAAVIAALKDYGVWLKGDLLARSNGDFRLGVDTFRKKLAYDEMVDLPLERLLEIAYADLHKNQAEFARVAKEVDPAKTPAQVLDELGDVHPPATELLQAFQSQFTSLIGFINAHKIITIPSKVQPTLEETPPFERATTEASMDPPGPFETGSTKAYFNVTLPEKSWTPEHIAEYGKTFNVGTITSTAVHEAYPGHYVQFLWQPQFPSKIRQVFAASTNVEGWAHYCEQMMLDEGYLPDGVKAGSREAKLIRLGQLEDALLRDARFVVSLRMHTGVGGALTFEQARDFFVTEGYQTPSIALVETKRGTSDAMYLYYTLGKLQILKLRADLQNKQGCGSVCRDFTTR